VAAYCPDDTGILRLHTLQVFTVTAHGIAHNVVFQDPTIFSACELTPTLDPGGWQ
jgi:RNA polymerase sigma-70 factor (ECF subfamily)